MLCSLFLSKMAAGDAVQGTGEVRGRIVLQLFEVKCLSGLEYPFVQ